MKTLPQNDMLIELAARLFRSLGEPYRLRLLQLLEAGEQTVGELVTALDGNQSNISKHLQILYNAGIIARRREGTSVYYAISDPWVLELCQTVYKGAVDKSREQFENLNMESVRARRVKR